jgi:hypothetical protein
VLRDPRRHRRLPGRVGRHGRTGAAAPIPGAEHGTHVAGIVAGARTSPDPQRGVAPGASVVAIQVFSQLDDGSFAAQGSDLLAALDWVQTTHAAHQVAAINLSLGHGAYPGTCDHLEAWEPIRLAVDRLRQQGVLTIAASGNDGLPGAMAAPACLSNVVSVGAVDGADRVRAQMAAFLWRMAGEPTSTTSCGFDDVPAGAFYAKGACWLKAQGITTGWGGNTAVFNPSRWWIGRRWRRSCGGWRVSRHRPRRVGSTMLMRVPSMRRVHVG